MKYLMCNLKSNLTLEEIMDYEHDLRNFSKKDVNLVIYPSSPYLVFFRNNKYNLGSQDVSSYEGGAYTGEVNATQLKSLGVKYSLIGHSERRIYFNEDNKIIIQKIKRIIANNIKPVYIIGETKEEKLRGKTMSVLNSQITKVFNHFTKEELENFIIAYEPVWAVNKSDSITKDELIEIVLYIKKIMQKYTDKELSIIYGGGVNKENILDFYPYIDGYLISSSAQNPKSLEEIYNKIINFDKN